jgi:integrase
MRFIEHALHEYRRHTPTCKLTKMSEMNCNCPIWAVGRIHGERFRGSLGTRSRQTARRKVAALLERKQDAPPEEPAKASPTVAAAIREYLAFCENNKRLKASTLTSYRNTLKHFAAFSEDRLYRTLDRFDLGLFEQFQAARALGPKTMRTAFIHLGSFCARGVELGWLRSNFARKVKVPKADEVSTLPFREAEARAILAACGRLGEDAAGRGGYAVYSAARIDQERRYARALVLVLLTTGLRISDVVNLGRGKVFIDRKGATRLRLRTEKTGVVITLRLPHATVEALKKLPPVSDTLYFRRDGDEGGLRVASERARRMIARLGSIAGVEDARPHRFRDTFAKEALLAGTPLRTVQLVLGHRSIRTTEEHYAPFVPEYQEMIDAATDAVAGRLIA